MKRDFTRTERIDLMSILYQYDLNQGCHEHFDTLDMDASLYEIYQDIVSRLNDIDQLIEKHLFNYRLNRLSYVDRAIIRLAVYELMCDVQKGAVAINEAIELTKIYTNLDDEKQHKFNNKLLDSIYQSIKD